MENQEKINEIVINNVTLVPKSAVKTMAFDSDGKPYQIVRTYSAGVFAGYIEKRDGQEVTMRNARRLWQWDGAASLSQLAMEGTKKPQNCKFPCEVDKVQLLNAIEILDCTEAAQKSIKAVAVWQM